MMRMLACRSAKNSAAGAPRGGSFPCFAEPEERHASVLFRISTPSAMMKPVLEPVFPVRSTDLAERTWPITSDCLR